MKLIDDRSNKTFLEINFHVAYTAKRNAFISSYINEFPRGLVNAVTKQYAKLTSRTIQCTIGRVT